MNFKIPIYILEKIKDYSDYEFTENDTAIILTFDKQPFAQVKYDLSKTKVENIEVIEPDKIRIHSLRANESDPQIISDNSIISYLYKEKYVYWLYFKP
jgi:hypothetical protein